MFTLLPSALMVGYTVKRGLGDGYMNRATDEQSFLSILSMMLSWALMSVMILAFYFAFFDSSNQVLIDVNRYGEKTIEAIILVPVWLLSTWNVLVTWKRIW